MAQVDYIRPVEALHGKLQKKDKVGYAQRKASKNNFTVTRDSWKMVYTDPAKAQAARIRGAKFKSVSQSVSVLHRPIITGHRKVVFRSLAKCKTYLVFLFQLAADRLDRTDSSNLCHISIGLG